ncbi:xanthine dehydrogenase accessory protein XdhC [Szabonella alba]|uniref:Xanthine dehydrogenase accessory protein XdhC n=1 Tax=Szabonella alba TaxID=2804194 RepID=A0A8K0V6T2_9RHOB|nr:xanthine dehydrogenase accessory protein XdhC [Szabonella alba]MBL4916226.1 xanthine dehydrogenase accessory protein XdhC [Szabonella alba]
MFDRAGVLAAIAAHGPVARVVVAGIEGSSPREPGAAMLVWPQGQSGTIGGGALEYQAAARARDLLARRGARVVDRVPLGPAIGQCCGGAVTLLTEIYSASDTIPDDVVARPVTGEATEPPLAVQRLLARARGQGQRPAPQLLQGWMVEPVLRPERQIWIWGAGHVGRALVGVLAPLPGFGLTWVDTARDRFPDAIPEGVEALWTPHPERLATHAPQDAEHLVLTYSHALDLELCHRLLGRGFHRLGLIGSATKWARFRSRLGALGHGATSIARIDCPIGDLALGKHPQAIAIGVAAQLMNRQQQSETEITDDLRDDRTFAAGGADQGLSGRRRQ